MSALTERDSHRWSRLRQAVGAVLWSSFLAASFATMVFFALFDPQLLGDDTAVPGWLADRMSGYAIGFFFFWVVCAIAGFLTAFLLDTRSANIDDRERKTP